MVLYEPKVMTDICVSDGILYYYYYTKQKNSLNLTFLGLRGTRSLSLFIPGIMTVILLGPFIPKTFVSWCRKYIKKNIFF